MSRVFAIVAVVACCVGLVLPATGSTKTAAVSKYLWATVNFCDTANHPDMMGVRASMPGDGEHTKMYMRFSAQYYDRKNQLWSEVTGSGVSRWRPVGSGDNRSAQSGYTFGFDPPASGKVFTLRGAVDFKWTKGRRVVRTAHLVTKAGHPGTAGADPKTYSASLCEVSD
jgi:hypothetical protein